MDLQKLLSSIDDDILAEVINGCEGKMGEPFAKKKLEVEVSADDKPADEMLAVGESSEDDLSPEELEELLKLQEA